MEVNDEIERIYENDEFNSGLMLKFIKQDNIEIQKYYDFNKTKSFRYFNMFHIKHEIQNRVYRISKNTVPEPYSKLDYPEFEIKLTTDGGEVNKHKFTYLWLNSEFKNQIDAIIFNPIKKRIPNKYNYFTGFRFEQKDEYDENKIIEYINHVKYMCNNDEKLYNYVINWIGHIFQNPHQKTQVAIILYSFTEGSGKNLLIQPLEKILGKYYLKLKNSASFAEKFNSSHMGKLLMQIDEINAKAKDCANELKDFITRDKQVIEYKGKESFMINDYVNLIITTNNELVININETDRRFVIINCPEVRLNKIKVDNLLKLLNDDDALEELFNYFMGLDLSDFNPRDIVNTDYKKELVANNLPPYLKMFKLYPHLFCPLKPIPSKIENIKNEIDVISKNEDHQQICLKISKLYPDLSWPSKPIPSKIENIKNEIDVISKDEDHQPIYMKFSAKQLYAKSIELSHKYHWSTNYTERKCAMDLKKFFEKFDSHYLKIEHKTSYYVFHHSFIDEVESIFN